MSTSRSGSFGSGSFGSGSFDSGSSDGPSSGSSGEVSEIDPVDHAHSICLRQLTMGPRTRGQLETVLRRQGVDHDVAAQVLDRLVEVSLVDDVAYSQNYVRSRHSGRGLARRAIGQELRGRGVTDEVVAEALEELDPDEEIATAHALVAKRISATRSLDMQVRTRRLVGMLARKGYPGGLSMRVVREALLAERELDELETRFLEGLDNELSDAARVGE